MNEYQKYIDLAIKLKAMAEQGEGGEKYNAQKQLDKIMRKYGISKEELNDELRRTVEFIFPKKQHMLFTQIAVSVTGYNRSWWYDKTKKTTIIGEVTKLEEAEIRAKFNFFWKEWEKKQTVYLVAFIHKNQLFPKGTKEMAPEDIENLTEKQRERLQEIIRSMGMINQSMYYVPLGKGKRV